MTQNLDYGELFCEAVDTIVQERLSRISFDKTILCTIVDDSKRAQGKYIVSENNKTKFEAYSSDTSYRNDNNVYVQIPSGDWNQQKIIISKKTDSTVEPYTYQKPFSRLVDITGNIVSNDIEHGLTANAFQKDESGAPLDDNIDELQAVTIWTYTGEELVNYTRLGISASFMSWLNPFYDDANMPRRVINGEYGLRLRIATRPDSLSKEEASSVAPAVYEVYLNQQDMNGNPYEFNTYFQQEKVVDVSTIGAIQQIEVQFYQVRGTFQDIQEVQIPFKDFLGNVIKPNLFVKDLYISLGYDSQDFGKETILINSLNSKTYSGVIDDLKNNYKKLQLRWIQQSSELTFKSINEDDKMDYEIRWYRYKLGAPSADKYSGIYWSLLSTQKKEGSNWAYTIDDEDWSIYNELADDDNKLQAGFMSSWLLPNTSLPDERIKAIVIYQGNVYYSNTLLFENEEEVSSKIATDAIQNLSIKFKDDSYGNYMIYNQAKTLIDFQQGRVTKEFAPQFKSAAGLTAELTEASSIEWVIPTEKTMIVLDEEYYSDQHAHVDTESDPGKIHIIRYGYGAKNNDLRGINTQKYRIKQFYSQNYGNNTIQCKIVKDGIVYVATHELKFGAAGTAGTDYTLVLNFENGVNAVNIKKDENDVFEEETYVRARLYDYDNNEINLLTTKGEITWSWKEEDESPLIDIVTTNDNTRVQLISRVEEVVPNYHILKATLTGVGDCKLIAYLPIPLKASKEYSYLLGASQILYDSAGELSDYLRSPYELYDNNGNLISDVDWSSTEETYGADNYYYAHNKVNGEENYTPKLWHNIETNKYYLQPLTFYVEDACNSVCVTGKIIIKQKVENQPTEDETTPEVVNYNMSRSSIFDGTDVEDIYNNATGGGNTGNENPEGEENTDPEITPENPETPPADGEGEGTETPPTDNEEEPEVPPAEGEDPETPPAEGEDPDAPPSEGGDDPEDPPEDVEEPEIPEDVYKEIEIVVWSQPILFERNDYAVSEVNGWDGNLKIDEENGTILTTKFVAGKKDANNKFSGVVMGDWSQSDGESSIITTPGIFGFNGGNQTFGFKNDGTAFLGKSSGGRLTFDGNRATIQSSNYEENTEGMLIDLDDGIIRMERSPLYNEKLNLYTGRGIRISNKDDIYPLKIGENFSVKWDGTVEAGKGQFTGEINAQSGTIAGNLTISGGSLSGGEKKEDENGNLIEGSTYWSIDSTGKAIFSAFEAVSGRIAGCEIKPGGLSSSSSNGSWQIGNDGKASFTDATYINATLKGTFTGAKDNTGTYINYPKFENIDINNTTITKATISSGKITSNVEIEGIDVTIKGKKFDAITLNLVKKVPTLKTDTKKVLVLKDGVETPSGFEDFEVQTITYVVDYDGEIETTGDNIFLIEKAKQSDGGNGES